jgi:hypothetical protein
VVDLTFVSRAIADRATHRILKHAKGSKSDHRISETILDINFEREISGRYIWRQTSRPEFNDMVEAGLQEVECSPPEHEPGVMQLITDVITEGISPAIAALVPFERCIFQDQSPRSRR